MEHRESQPIDHEALADADRLGPTRLRPSITSGRGSPAVGFIGVALFIGVVVLLGGSAARTGATPSAATASDTQPSVATTVPSASAQATQPVAASLPASSVTSSDAVAIARQNVRAQAVFASVIAGPFAESYSPPPNHPISAANPIHATDLVWVVTFSDEFTICPPDGSPCFSPRPGTTTVVLDYKTGAFLGSSGYAPAP